MENEVAFWFIGGGQSLVLLALGWLIKRISDLDKKVSVVCTTQKHTPTRKEVTDEIGQTRQYLREELREHTKECDRRLRGI